MNVFPNWWCYRWEHNTFHQVDLQVHESISMPSSTKASLRFKPHHWRCFEVISWQSLLWVIMPQVVKDSQKIQGLIEEVWPSWINSWFLDHKYIFSSIPNIWKWLWFLWFLIIILNNFYLHDKNICARRLVKIEKGSQGILLL